MRRSNYRPSKDKSWKEKHRESDANTSLNDKSSKQKRTRCQKCSRKPTPEGHGEDKCPALESTCNGCGKKGHWLPGCPDPGSGSTRTGRVTVEDTVVVRRVYSPEVVEDGSPLPLMDNCKIEPIVMKEGKLVRDPKVTVLSLFPDPGYQETLIAESMVSRLGLQVNPSRSHRWSIRTM